MKYIIPVFLFAFMMSCVSVETQETESESSLAASSDTLDAETKEEPNVNERKAEIDDYIAQIEANLSTLEKSEMDMNAARAKISQKWKKMHAYSNDGNVVRIKTYPHEGISKRTEEFYFMEGDLVYAIIEDLGANDTTPGDREEYKAYYFDNGALLAYNNTSLEEEEEPSEEDMEAKTLMLEAKEYLEMMEVSVEE